MTSEKMLFSLWYSIINSSSYVSITKRAKFKTLPSVNDFSPLNNSFISFTSSVNKSAISQEKTTTIIQISWLVMFIAAKGVEPCKFSFIYSLIDTDKWKIQFIIYEILATSIGTYFIYFYNEQFHHYNSSCLAIILGK